MPRVRLDDRAIVAVSGKDAEDLLQGLITTDLDALAPDEARPGALLTPQGKILFDFMISRDGDGLRLETARDQAEALLKRLTMYKLRRDVTVEATALKVFAAWDGPSEAPYDPRLPGLGRRFVAESAEGDATLSEYEAHRLALGVPDSAVRAEESPPELRPSEVAWREEAAEGKLDLLTTIDFRMTSNAIFSDVVLPAATFAQGYESYRVELADGRVAVGVITRRTADGVVLRDAGGAEVRVPARAVEGMTRAPTSLMPDGLARAVTPDELRDLFAYLRSRK